MDVSPPGARSPASKPARVNAIIPIGLPATRDTSTIHVPAPRLVNGTPAFTRPKANRMNCTGTFHACSNRFIVSGRYSSRGSKSPRSRLACGMNGRIGTSASAGWKPPRYIASHDRPPATSAYGQTLVTRRRRSSAAAASAGTISAAKRSSTTGPLG